MKAAPPAPSPDWSYFLDVDGTLIELADSPERIMVDPGLPASIRVLYALTGGAVALVSGRSLEDLDRRLGCLPVPMAGQHGLEIRDGDGWERRHGLAPEQVEHIVAALAPLMARHPGLLVERKGAALAVHYRLAPRLGGHLGRMLRKLIANGLHGVELQPGKRVLELKPRGFDKGSSIRELAQRLPFRGRRPVFIGDDLTDEHGFKVVNQLGGVTIKVGPGRTCASHRLPDVAAVRRWLDFSTDRP